MTGSQSYNPTSERMFVWYSGLAALGHCAATYDTTYTSPSGIEGSKRKSEGMARKIYTSDSRKGIDIFCSRLVKISLATQRPSPPSSLALTIRRGWIIGNVQAFILKASTVVEFGQILTRTRKHALQPEIRGSHRYAWGSSLCFLGTGDERPAEAENAVRTLNGFPHSTNPCLTRTSTPCHAALSKRGNENGTDVNHL